jgi:hypothetical protein
MQHARKRQVVYVLGGTGDLCVSVFAADVLAYSSHRRQITPIALISGDNADDTDYAN